MTQITLSLDADALREATQQAIVGTLTPELREKVLEQAISALLTPSSNPYAKSKAPIQEAFERAIERLANEEAQKMVSGNEVIRERLQALLRDTADKILNTDTSQLAERMSDALVDSLRR